MAILTLTEYKDYKSINSDTEDTKNQLLIDAVNTFIEAYCGRVFTTYYSTNKTEYFDADDVELYPVEIPIVGVVTLETSADAGETYATALVEYTDYIIDSSNESIVSLKDVFVTPTYKYNAVKLVYNGGYSSIPNDLQLAAVHLVEYYSEEGYTPRKALAGASTDNVIQPDMTARLPQHIRRTLESYRNIVF